VTANNFQDVERSSKRKSGWLRGFTKDRKGTTVIEFALLAFPFSLLIFAILESCISFAAEEYMQNVTDDVAREFRVGKPWTKKAVVTKEQVRDKICDQLEVFVSDGCPGLSIDLRSFNTFAEAAALRHTIKDGDIYPDGGSFKFEPGTSQTKNILRVFYRWPIMTDLMRSRMSNLDNNAALHFATATWQNEPFDD
jgi:Flp pilus assembly protein TadG